jgi:hypothetical protein
MHVTSETMLTNRDFLCSKVKTGRSIGRSEWQTALIEEMGSSFLMVHVSAMFGGTHPHLTLNSTMVSMRTYLTFFFASLRLQEPA